MSIATLDAWLLAAVGTWAQAQPPQPPEVAARSYLLIDLTPTRCWPSARPTRQADPASLTKLMTAYLVFNAIRDKKLTLEQTLPVSRARLGRAQGRRLADVHRHRR